MFIHFFRKKSKKHAKRKKNQVKRLKALNKKLEQVSTKEDVEKILKEIVSSREIIVQEVTKLPDSLSSLLVEQITSPLKEFLSSELSSNQAVKQIKGNRLSSNQAVKQIKSVEEAITTMKVRLEMLSQRHLKALNILVQNRDVWLDYEEIGSYCTPQLTGSCIRGYVADLINSYKIPIEKKNFGRKSKVRLSQEALKHLAIAKLTA